MDYMAILFLAIISIIFIYSIFKLFKFFTVGKSDSSYEYELIEDEGITYEKVVDRYDNEK